MEASLYGRNGSPWEFNLRDVFRWCELMIREQVATRPIGHESDEAATGGEAWQPWLIVDTLYVQRMRTCADREALLTRFKEVFPEAFPACNTGGDKKEGHLNRPGTGRAEGNVGTRPLLRVTPDWLQIGQTVLPRGCWSEVAGRGGDECVRSRDDALMPVALRRPLQALARCVAMGWPSLVVGHRGSGKTCLIRGLAAGVGARLTEVAMTPSMDVTELLGCFEQADTQSQQVELFECLEYVAEAVCIKLCCSDSDVEHHSLTASVWDAFHTVQRCYINPTGHAQMGDARSRGVVGFDKQGMIAVEFFLQVVRGVVEEESTNISGTTMRASATRKDDSFWSNLRQHLHQAKVLAAAVQRQNIGVAQESAGKNQPRRAGASCFKWSDGILVKALQRGDWLVFESANLCSASVLDRINPLLEPGGVLMLTECGSTSDGDETHGAVDSAAVHRVVRPHPNFRLFLTADPSCGEVSRAMRNRCVEIFLLDNQAGVSLELAATKTAGRGYGSPSVLVSEHASDLLSIIGAYGLGHLSALTAAMISTHCTQRARPAHGESGPSAAGGTTPRSLALLAELVAAAYSRGVTSCDHNPHEVLEKVVSLAYPRLTTATATGGELLFVKAMLSSLLPNSNDISGCAASAAEGVTRAMMPPEWRARTSDSVGSQVSADGRVLCILEVITEEGSSRAGEMLASLVLEGTYTVGAVEGAGNTSPALDTSFFVGLRDITTLDKMEMSREDFFSHLASHFVRRTSVADRGQRAALAARISQDRNGRGRYPKLSDLVIPMTEALMESHSWAEISAILSDLKDQVKGLFSDKTHGNAEAPGSLLASASAALSVWAPADPRSNIDHLYGVERFVNYGSTWKPLVLYLSLLDAAVGMRLPLILREEAEVSKASSRLKSGRSGEGGLGWIGLSYLVSEGGRNITQTSSRGGLRSAETRLARTALVPYLAPLIFAVDSWLKQYLCRQVVDIVTTLGEKAADEFHSALAGVYHARDSLSHVLATTSANQAEPDASAGAVLLVFPWDLFLVSWSWVCERTAVLRSVSPPAVSELSGVSSTCANFEAVRSRIEAAVVQHAGGSSLASDSLWAHGARAAAPTTGAAACALGRLHRLASEFRVSYRPHASSGISTLGSLLESAHPSLCVPDDAKRELLHALCTLQWAASSEVEDIGDSTLRTDPADEGVERNGRDGPATTVALAESLPQVLEEVVRTAQARFTKAHKGTRYDVDVSKNEPAQEDHGVQDTRRFDDFETEAQEAVANSTLLVVSDHADDDREGENVLRRWAAVQLASFMEHWIVAEECKVLAALSQLSLENQETFSDLNRAAPLMPRIVRLRSALLATPTLSPAVARPYQTLIWAWENNLSASGLRAMLKKILPVALDAWGQRLWDNLFQSPGTILTELGPPRMVQDGDDIVFPGVTGSKRRDHPDDTSWGGGPAQLLTLVRSAFLLRLSSSSVLQDKLTSDTARARGAQRREVVDLTLMNVSTRMAQFRTAMRLLRDLESASEEVLEKVLSLAWCRLYETLCSFDEASPAAEGVPSFSRAFMSPRERGDPPRTTASRVCRDPDEFEVEARKALSSCRDNRLTDLGDTLIVPCARAMCYASKVVGSSLCDEVESAQALTGLGITLLGCLRLMLLLPSSPVDPGMKPSLEKKLLERRLATVKSDLTAWRWLSRLEGGEDVPPGMEPLLQQARRLREECRRLGSESIERAADRPAFQTLFRDVHAFARGVGNPERVSSLAHNLSSLAGVADPPQEGLHQSRSETGSSAKAAKSRSAALEEEVVWQEAAGSFLERMRTEYMEAYPDVMTGLCDAIETCRLGLRLLAAACATNALGKSSAEESARQPGAVPTSCDSLIRLQSFLLRYPYPACERPTVNTARHDREDDGDSLGEELNFALTYRVPNGRGGSGAQHMALLQAVLSRAEILLLSGSLEAPAVDCALKAMGAAVTAWSEAEAEKAEKEETEAEIIKYKMQEHVVQSAEAVDEKRLRMLFPDYHSRFKDILTAESDDSTADAIAADSVAAQEPSEDCTQPHALRHLSDEQLSSLVACHARLLLSLAVRKRIALRRLSVHYAAPTAGDDVSNSLIPARVMAFGDSYRAAVLLAGPTASAPACVPRLVSRPDDVGKDANIRGKFLDLEAAFAPAHMLAISDAARMCKSGTTLLWDASATKMCADFTRKSMMRGTPVKEEGVSGRSYEFVDSHVDFHRDPNVRETRLTDRPLTALLRRAANLLEEFPGHGILIQLARVADRVRRMPLHSPLAAVLAGVELTLRKAQDWEQNAHRGVSLKEELGPLSALVVRWRGIELKGWPQLLDGRERASVTKGSRWWLHLFRLLDGKWLGEADQDSLVEASTTGDHEAEESPTKVLSVPDWPTAKESFADWVWHGLVPEDRQFTRREAAKGGLSGFDPAGFARIRILFQALDDFIRTSSVGEFMARLQMLQAFAAHICAVAEEHPQSTTVAVVVQGIWRFYSQFSDDVMSSRDLVRNSIEKKLKEEVKLAKWDEQTYYSLAEASEKSHRKLCKLVSQYDEVLEVSVSEVLNRVFTAGVGERNDAGAKRAAPCTEIPSVGSMFAMVKKVDSSADFVEADADSDEAERNVADDTVMIHGVVVEAREPMEKELQKPEAKSRSARPCHASRTSLQLLDVCLPKEPQLLHSTREIVTDPRSIGWSPWLKVALLADSSTGSDGNTNKVGSLTARLSMLKKRMRSLLRESVYAKKSARWTRNGRWTDGGRPVGFLGAGLAEELCLAVFGRIQALRATTIGKQVKKRAVLDLLVGMRKQGLKHAKSFTPGEASDMLHVMAIPQPFAADQLAGTEPSWLLDNSVIEGHAPTPGAASAVRDILHRGERYFFKSLSELSRLRLEAGAPVARDLSRREAEVMKGLSEHLGLVILQQRGTAVALEREISRFAREINALRSLVRDYSIGGGKEEPSYPVDSMAVDENAAFPAAASTKKPLPAQRSLRRAVEAQRQGLRRSVESVREVQLLVKAMAEADPPSPSTPVTPNGTGWGQNPTDSASSTEATAAVSDLEQKTSVMLARLDQFPAPPMSTSTKDESSSDVAVPLLAAGAVAAVLENQESLACLATETRAISRKFSNVIPVAALQRVGDHLSCIIDTVRTCLNSDPVLRFWWVMQPGSTRFSESEVRAMSSTQPLQSSSPAIDLIALDAAQSATVDHMRQFGKKINFAVKSMLISVQSLCRGPRPSSVEDGKSDTTADGEVLLPERTTDSDSDGADEGLSVTGTTLMETHASSFEQARSLKLWRCADALRSVRTCMVEFSEAVTATGWADGAAPAAEATVAAVTLLRDVLPLAEQVLGAGRAVLTGIVAFNKGTAKLHYVTLRVFRLLLSKGLCSDETEEMEGDGEGDIEGMKFDDDVEGTGMGEGDGKKDVTDQIEDEEQLLGLKGDEPDKDQAEEVKELGEDEQDKGMEMENDFEGDMFDVPKGDQNDEGEEEAEDKEELDREMGDDLGDNADVVDEKLWDDDDDGQEEGKDEQEEKFEAGSRLDGEKPEEDEIRTKEDGHDDDEDGEGKEKDGGKEEDKGEDEADGKPEGNMGDDGVDQENADDEHEDGDDGEKEGLVNDDLEENYEDKPMGVEVRGEEEAMKVDEGQLDDEDKDPAGEDNPEELPDDLNLDEAQNDEDGDEGGGAEEGKDDDGGSEGGDGDEEGKEKEGFETLAPEDEAAETPELGQDENQPEGAGNPGAPEVDPVDEEGADADGGEDKDEGDETEKVEDQVENGKDEPPAFGVEGDDGDARVTMDASKDEMAEDNDGDDEDAREDDGKNTEPGGGSAAQGADDGGGGGKGEEGDGGEWRRDESGGNGTGEGHGKDKRRRPEAPNPFRNPGDVMKHWHRRLDMLKDNTGDEDLDGDEDTERGDEESGDKDDGKFEYVTSNEEGSSQVLGGVSEEQAAETAASQAADEGEKKEIDQAIVQGTEESDDDADAADAKDGLDEGEDQKGAVSDADGEEGEHAQRGDKNRKSGKKREEDGHEQETEQDADVEMVEADEDDSTVEKQPPVDLKLLDNADERTNPNQPQIVTSADIHGEASNVNDAQALREQLHDLAEELQRRRRDAEVDEEAGIPDAGAVLPAELWGKLRGVTAGLSQRLCEQLRLVLEPMVATKLQGDYRSGKRINMRRVIPYIASGFRKDKIWLRRTKPAKRDYQILMAIDDSQSMADCGAGALALAAMTTVASGLTQLEAGQLAVARFGEQLDLLHAFGEPFTEQAGAKIVSGFTFDQPRTNTAHMLEGVVALLEEARRSFSFSSGGASARGTPRQLVLMLSDGRFDRENKDRLRTLVREMNERGQLLVLIVLDKEGDTSILKTREASYVGGKLMLSSYLDKYPFPFYILLNHVEALPETLADALRQWFELLQRQMSS